MMEAMKPSASGTLGYTIGLGGLFPPSQGWKEPTFGGQPWGGFLLSLNDIEFISFRFPDETNKFYTKKNFR